MKSSTMPKNKAQVIIPEAKWRLSNKLLMIVRCLTWVLGGQSISGLMVEMEMKLCAWERLDRGLANSAWAEVYDITEVQVLARRYLDHNPILVTFSHSSALRWKKL
jgi:hypothetical protein